MEKEIVKQAFVEAEKSQREKQIDEVKAIVTKTLEKIKTMDIEIDNVKIDLKDLEEKKKLLKLDIDNLKEGRLDLIQERQEKDPRAKGNSVIIVIKETTRIKEIPVPYTSPWYYEPYSITWTSRNTLTSGSTATNINYINTNVALNGSISKFATPGTYTVEGTIINLK